MTHISAILGFWSPGPVEIIIVLVIALLLFGKRLPEVARSIGKSLTEFKRGMHETEEEVKKNLEEGQEDKPNSANTNWEKDDNA